MYGTAIYPSALTNGNSSSLDFLSAPSNSRSSYSRQDYSAPSRSFRNAFKSNRDISDLSSLSVSSKWGASGNTSGFRSTLTRPLLRSGSVPRSASSSIVAPVRSLIRNSLEEPTYSTRARPTTLPRCRSPSGPTRSCKETTRDDLIDSILHTKTRENRPMPGFRMASNWEERKAANIDCDLVYPGIMLANGETIRNLDYLKMVGVTHVLNTAERHVTVNPNKYPLYDISYFGFHVDDHPKANISRFFSRTCDYIDSARRQNGTVLVNCAMGWSRSATIVAAYLVTKKGMTAQQALETIRRHRPIRPNPGFLEQLAFYENAINKGSYLFQ